MIGKRLIRIDRDAERHLHREYRASERTSFERGGALCGGGNIGGGWRVESIVPHEQHLKLTSSFLPPPFHTVRCPRGAPIGIYHTHPNRVAYPSEPDRLSPTPDCVLGIDGIFCYRGRANIGMFRWRER